MTGTVDGLFQGVLLEEVGDSFDYRKYLEQKGLGEGFLSLGCVHNDIHIGLYLGVGTFRYISFLDWLTYVLGLLIRPMQKRHGPMCWDNCYIAMFTLKPVFWIHREW